MNKTQFQEKELHFGVHQMGVNSAGVDLHLTGGTTPKFGVAQIRLLWTVNYRCEGHLQFFVPHRGVYQLRKVLVPRQPDAHLHNGIELGLHLESKNVATE